MSEEKRLALLIDSDNVSAKYAQFILQEASRYGELTYKRVYGDWEKNNTGWRIPAMNNSILAVQQSSYIAGKNATDFSMIIDAMDILYTGNVDGFVLVTSDSDFTRLAVRLREAGMLVVGIGEVKTPIAFTSSCHHFSYLNQVCDSIGDYNEKTLRKDIVEYVKENDDGKLDLVKINAYLTSRYGSIDYAAFGYNRLSMFIDSFSELKRSSNFVSLKSRSTDEKAKTPDVQPSATEIAAVITEYLERQNGLHDDISKVNEYVTKIFGKVDFGRFGSKKFARFLDKCPNFTRRGNDVMLSVPPVSSEIALAKSTAKAVSENTEITEKESEKTTLRITSQLFSMEVKKYASDNMPKGGNVGQLNNMLLEKYGKTYVSELGFADFAAALSSVTGVSVEKNFVRLTEVVPAPQNAEETITDTVEPLAGNVSDTVIKPEINAVRQDILAYAAQNDNSAPLTELGTYLTKKYGKGYLKELGFATTKKLVAGMSGTIIKDNVLLLLDMDIVKRDIFEYLAQNENSAPMPSLGIFLTQKYGNRYLKVLGFGTLKKLLASIDEITVKDDVLSLNGTDGVKSAEPLVDNAPDTEVKPEINAVKQDIFAYAARNGNSAPLPALGIFLTKKYGKGYLKELGFNTMKKLLASIDGITVNDNVLSLDEPPEPTAEKSDDIPDINIKPEINAVKRDIFAFASQNENSAPLPALGTFLAKKYGKDYLKELGFTTMKKLISSIKGVSVRDNVLSLTKKFIKRTDEIEQFVYDFAHSDGKRSIKALSGKIKKQFDDFDFTDYGYSKFSDFISAIDGVRANGYYVEADDRD